MAPPQKHPASVPSSSTRTAEGRRFKSQRPQHKNHPPPASDALPGVQKIKAALRQTRRLLAKDTLAADKRVETERRLKSLEGDLAKAEQARLERTMATRYHKVKFFERQKVMRKLAQTQKKLAEATEKKERKKLEARLAELRIDLNYTLHYPRTKKYISLFPPEARQKKDAEQTARDEQEKLDTNRQRDEVRQWVRAQMESGALSWEPEVELERNGEKGAGASQQSKKHGVSEMGDAAGEEKSRSPAKQRQSRVVDDDFFAVDGEDVEVAENESEKGSSEDSDSMDED